MGDPGTGAPGGLGLGWDWNWGGNWDWGGYGVGEGLMADCQQLKSVKAHTYIRYTQINRFNLFCHFYNYNILQMETNYFHHKDIILKFVCKYQR